MMVADKQLPLQRFTVTFDVEARIGTWGAVDVAMGLSGYSGPGDIRSLNVAVVPCTSTPSEVDP
jgi:hypothetical protein